MMECVAETRDIRQLEKIRKQQLEAREVLQQLDQRHLVRAHYTLRVYLFKVNMLMLLDVMMYMFNIHPKRNRILYCLLIMFIRMI